MANAMKTDDLIEFAERLNEKECPLLEKAILFATVAHAEQRDKLGKPYILHPLRVMNDPKLPYDPSIINTEAADRAKIVAVLHDVIEDSPATVERLETVFGSLIATDVETLTKRKNETGYAGYIEYINRIARSNNVVKAVKKADIRDNSSAERLIYLPTATQDYLRDKYNEARRILGMD